MRDLRDLSLDELEAFVVEHGESRFRAEQMYRWLHQHGDCLISHAEKFSITPGSAVRKIEELRASDHSFNEDIELLRRMLES